MIEQTETSTKINGSENVLWNLSDLYNGFSDEKYLAHVTNYPIEAEAFYSKYKNSIATSTDEALAEMLVEYEKLSEVIGGLYSYVHLVWTTNSTNPEFGKQLQLIAELDASTSKYVQFVFLELGKLSYDRQQQLLQSQYLRKSKRWLEKIFLNAKHQLAEDVENALAVKAPYSTSAWTRLHDELIQKLEFPFESQMLQLPEILLKTSNTNREIRKTASESIGKVLEKASTTQAFIFNTVVADYAASNTLRGYSSWVERRNQGNEVSNEAVESLINSVVQRYDIVQRFFTLKKSILGFQELFDYDRAAPIGSEAREWTWDEARELVSSAYHSFSSTVGNIVDLFFENNWLHAPVQRGKATGAFSAGTISSVHPYILMNFTGTTRDVQVLAHELGHGVHQFLSREQGVFGMYTPLTIAETASVFGEMITFTEIMKRTASDSERLALLIGKIDDIVATVFRQIALNRFENVIHNTRANEGELSVEKIRELWVQTQKEQFGNTITITDGYENYWTYVSHFLHNPGYVYAYAFGELLTLALFEEFQVGTENFQEKYIELLKAGSSVSPQELLKPFNINPESQELWTRGLNAIERLVQQAEELYAKIQSTQ